MIIFKTETKNKNRLHVNRNITKQKLRLSILIGNDIRYEVADINELVATLTDNRANFNRQTKQKTKPTHHPTIKDY